MNALPSLIELRHLRYFLSAIEHGSFRKAAGALHVCESTISRRVRDLEDELGASLFIRSNQGVLLTTAGESFRSHATAVFQQLSDGAGDVLAIGRGASGSIRIGIMASIASEFPSELLRAFSERHPSVRIELVDGDPIGHISAIRRFDLDVALLVAGRDVVECDTITLWTERIVASLPVEHPLSKRDELSWVDFVSETFIGINTALGRELRARLSSSLSDLGHIPLIQSQSIDYETALALVRIGPGLVLNSEAAAAANYPGIIHRPIRDEELTFEAVWHPNHDNPALRRFISLAKTLTRHDHKTVQGPRPGGPQSDEGRVNR